MTIPPARGGTEGGRGGGEGGGEALRLVGEGEEEGVPGKTTSALIMRFFFLKKREGKKMSKTKKDPISNIPSLPPPLPPSLPYAPRKLGPLPLPPSLPPPLPPYHMPRGRWVHFPAKEDEALPALHRLQPKHTARFKARAVAGREGGREGGGEGE
jgi:hypothetical protein